MSCSRISSNAQFRPNVFMPTMYLVVHDLNSPSRRITGDGDRSPVVEPLYRGTKLFRFARFDLFASFNILERWIAGRAGSSRTLCIVYPIPKGLISHF